jgi:hypothetical protein
MSTKQVLFIGGPIDGCRKVIDSSLEYYYYCEDMPPVDYIAFKSTPVDPVTIKKHMYRSSRLSYRGTDYPLGAEWEVFVHTDIPDSMVIACLIGGYRNAG